MFFLIFIFFWTSLVVYSSSAVVYGSNAVIYGNRCRFRRCMKSKQNLSPPTTLTGPNGEHIPKPSMWERFIGADGNKHGYCAFVCNLTVVLVCIVAGAMTASNADGMGLFILADDVIQAYFAHFEFLTGRIYFTDMDNPTALVEKRTWPAFGGTVFIEVKGTKCPGDDCDLSSKNVIQPRYIDYMRRVESTIWGDGPFQSNYCALMSSWTRPNLTACAAPYSPLSLFLWGDGAIDKSRELIADGFGYISPGYCSTWGSPLDATARCSSPLWTPVMPDSGAAEPAGLEDYIEVFEKMCGKYIGDQTYDWDYWRILSAQFFPSFTCENDHVFKHGLPFIRSHILVGLPVRQDKMNTDIVQADELEVELAEDYGTDLWELVSGVLDEIMDEDDSVTVHFKSLATWQPMTDVMLVETMNFVFVSLFLVWLYMWFNVESLFVTNMGMFQILMSIFPPIFIWDTFINQQGLQLLQLIGIFLILGIGADTVFVLNDALTQAKAELKDVPGIRPIHMFSIAYRRSMSAMVATTMTTSMAFFIGCFSKIPSIRDFCIFACFIVLSNFILCITLGAASLAFQNRFMAGQFCCCCGGPPNPGGCCSMGCCFGMTRIFWNKLCGDKKKSKSETGAPESKTIERFLEGPAFNFLHKFRYFFIILWILVLSACAVSATFVKISDTNPEGFPDEHPETRTAHLERDYFRQAESEKIRVIWGLKDGEPVSEWSETESETPSKIELKEADMNTALSPEGQEAILDLCRSADERAGKLRCENQGCLILGSPEPCERTHYGDGLWYNVEPLCNSGRYCIMEQVKDYADLNNLTFPMALDDIHRVANSTAFHNYLRDYWQRLEDVGQHWHAMQYRFRTGFAMEAGKIVYMWVTYNATFEGFFKPKDEGTGIFNDWDNYLKSYVGNTKFYHISFMYLFKILQDALIQEFAVSISCSLGVAFVTLMFVTWNWYLAIIGTLNLITILCIFLGLWPPLGWDLDMFNVIFCIMAVGLSVDYTVHLVHAFNEAEVPDRESRVRHALAAMGITVISGALTTILAGAPLMASQPPFFSRFGLFIILCIVLSLTTALFVLIPILLVIGPNGKFGDISLFYKLWDKLFGQSRPEKTMEMSATSEQGGSDMSNNKKQFGVEKLAASAPFQMVYPNPTILRV